jgi:hypothetical protein
MNEMIERVAAALYRKRYVEDADNRTLEILFGVGGIPTWSNLRANEASRRWHGPDFSQHLLDEAKAAIEAMREPTDDMLIAQHVAAKDHPTDVIGCYNAMIGAALNPASSHQPE